MKYVRKLIPVHPYDIPGTENWLEEQANAGLFPVRMGLWGTFVKNGVPGTRFRLEARGSWLTLPSHQQLELYRDMGWDYACPIDSLYLLYYSTDPAAPELFTDWNSRGISLDRLARQVRRGRVALILYVLLLLSLVLLPFWYPFSEFDVQPQRGAQAFLLLLKLGSPFLLCYLLFLLISYSGSFSKRSALLRTHRALREGLPPPPSPGPKRWIQWKNGLILLLIPLLFVSLLGQLFLSSPVAPSSLSRPYLALGTLEKEPIVPFEEISDVLSNYHKKENQAIRQVSLFAPVWYEVNQRLYSQNGPADPVAFSPDPDGGKNHYAPSLDAAYFHLALPALARPVAQSQLNSFRLVNLYWVYEEMDYPGLDFVLLAHAEGHSVWQMAALGKGNRLAVYRYSGQEQLRDCLDLLAAPLQA